MGVQLIGGASGKTVGWGAGSIHISVCSVVGLCGASQLRPSRVALKSQSASAAVFMTSTFRA